MMLRDALAAIQSRPSAQEQVQEEVETVRDLLFEQMAAHRELHEGLREQVLQERSAREGLESSMQHILAGTSAGDDAWRQGRRPARELSRPRSPVLVSPRSAVANAPAEPRAGSADVEQRVRELCCIIMQHKAALDARLSQIQFEVGRLAEHQRLAQARECG